MAVIQTALQLYQGHTSTDDGINENGKRSQTSEKSTLLVHGYTLKATLCEAFLHKFAKLELWDWYDDTIAVPLDKYYAGLECTLKEMSPTGIREAEFDCYTDNFLKKPSSGCPLFMYIEGVTGTGKTTLVKRMLVDWAKYHKKNWWTQKFRTPKNVRKHLDAFDFAFPIFLKNVTTNQTVMKAIIEQTGIYFDCHILEKALQGKEHRILFMVDGLDEFKEETSPHISDLIKRRYFANTNLIITSRNPSHQYYSNEGKPYIEIALKGFSKESIRLYISKFFQNSKQGNMLLKTINESEDLEEMARYPALLLLFCSLWRDKNTLAHQSPDLYINIVKYFCGRHQRKFLEKVNYSNKTLILNKYHDTLMTLGDIAVDLLKGRPNLKSKFVNALEENSTALGLFRSEMPSFAEKNIHFLHRHLRDVLVAYYFVHSETDTQKHLLLTFNESAVAKNQRSFISKCLQGNGGEKITVTQTAIQLAFQFKDKENLPILPNKMHFDFVCEYNSELADRYFSMDTPGLRELTLIAPSNMYTPNLHNLTSWLSKCPYLKYLDLSDTQMDDKTLEGLRTSLCRLEKLIVLKLGRYTGQNLKAIFLQLAHCLQLKVLDVSQINMDCNVTEGITVILSFLKYLAEIRLGHSSNCELRSLLENLQKCSDLEVLDLLAVTMIPSDLDFFSNVLTSLVNLKELSLGQLGEGNQLLITLIGNLGQLENLEVLNMKTVTGCGDVYEALSMQIKNWPKVRILRLGRCEKKTDMEPFVNVLDTLTNLNILDMSCCIFSEEILTKLTSSLRHLTLLTHLSLGLCCSMDPVPLHVREVCQGKKLEVLDLSGNIPHPNVHEVLDVRGYSSGNQVRKYVYQTLAEIMQDMPSLRELRLPECDDPHGLIPIVASLEYVTQIEVLDMSGNTALSETLDAFGERLKSLRNLKSLRLCACQEINAISKVIENLHFFQELQVLDISGIKAKTAKRCIYEEFDQGGNIIGAPVYRKLCNQLNYLSDLRELRLCQCKHNDGMGQVIKALQQTPRLHTLDLSRNGATEKDFVDLGERVMNLGELQELRLCYSKDWNAVKKMIQCLHKNFTSNLIVLDLTGGNTTVMNSTHGVQDVLCCLQRLRELRISKFLDIGSVQSLMTGIQGMPDLQVLYMIGVQLGSKDLADFGEVVSNLRKLRQLILNNVTRGIHIHQAWAVCVQKLSNLSLLEVLDLSNNDIGSDTTEQLAVQLPLYKSLDALYLTKCELVSTEAIIKLIEALRDCRSLRFLYLAGNKFEDGLEQIAFMARELSGLHSLNISDNKMSNVARDNIRDNLTKDLSDLKLSV